MDSVGGVVEKVDLEPRMHMIADLSSEKFNLHLSQCSVELYELITTSSVTSTPTCSEICTREPWITCSAVA